MKKTDNAAYDKWETAVHTMREREAELWELQRKLSSTAYKSKWEQLNDVRKMGRIAEQVQRDMKRISKMR